MSPTRGALTLGQVDRLQSRIAILRIRSERASTAALSQGDRLGQSLALGMVQALEQVQTEITTLLDEEMGINGSD